MDVSVCKWPSRLLLRARHISLRYVLAFASILFYWMFLKLQWKRLIFLGYGCGHAQSAITGLCRISRSDFESICINVKWTRELRRCSQTDQDDCGVSFTDLGILVPGPQDEALFALPDGCAARNCSTRAGRGYYTVLARWRGAFHDDHRIYLLSLLLSFRTRSDCVSSLRYNIHKREYDALFPFVDSLLPRRKCVVPVSVLGCSLGQFICGRAKCWHFTLIIYLSKEDQVCKIWRSEVENRRTDVIHTTICSRRIVVWSHDGAVVKSYAL